MEKISYPPLIAHLSEQAEMYNQMYRENEIRYGPVSSSALSSWMVQVVEPLLKEVTSSAPDKVPVVFKALFLDLLQLLGNKNGIVYEQEYKKAWMLLTKIPSIVLAQPSRTIKAINSALVSLRTYQSERVQEWVAFMNNTIGDCQSIEEFLSVGRINAWLCGMAHLRLRAAEEYVRLRSELQTALAAQVGLEGKFDVALEGKWLGYTRPAFAGEAGGFTGNGGYFTEAPVVAKIGDQIFAADTNTSCAFYADRFGVVFLSENPVAPEMVSKQASTNGFYSYNASKLRNLVPFEDVSSFVVTPSTLVLTRTSSHYIYVYGLPA